MNKASPIALQASKPLHEASAPPDLAERVRRQQEALLGIMKAGVLSGEREAILSHLTEVTAATLGVAAWLAVPLMDSMTLRWFSRDLNSRGVLVANAMSESLEAALAGGRSLDEFRVAKA